MPAPNDPQSTEFGFQTVTPGEKTKKVQDVFDSVTDQYDLMNDLMSLGLHRWWKDYIICLARPRPGQTILDLAAGTGDISRRLHSKLQQRGQLIVCDLNAKMLQLARDQMINHNCIQGVHYVQADAQSLPFNHNSFDLITLAFGLRNITQKDQALSSLYHVLKPGGKLFILEFSHPTSPLLDQLTKTYTREVLPRLGQLIVGDADSYQYLAESIEKHPDQATLQKRIEAAGFEHCQHQNLLGGIVAIHHGIKS